MRFLIRVDDKWNVSIRCPAAGAGWEHTRRLRRLRDPAAGDYPLPPANDLPPDAEGYRRLCESAKGRRLRELGNRIARRAPRGDDVEVFGSYLFDALLGRAVWNGILEAADRAKDPLVELALSWPAAAVGLHRLNWEMMRAPEPDGFLAAGKRKNVIVTRLVGNTDDDRWKPRQITYPPRVLFVITTALSDATIRAGAECIALLRRLRKNERNIHRLILQQASRADVRKAVESFTPDVVHYIGHGIITGNSACLLLREDAQSKEPAPCDANGLLGDLRYKGVLPLLVVLSACHSADVVDAVTAPLAADLVAGGVPIVVGMAGRVADRACRLFTRRLGEALVGGDSLVLAAAEGRWAAFVEGAPPRESIDWALPRLFLAERVPPNFSPISVPNGQAEPEVEKRLEHYDLLRDPVFCGREPFFEAYYQVLAADSALPRVLGICTRVPTPSVGRTRLLMEFNVQAVRDGHIPCLISSPVRPWEPPIKNPGQLAVELLRAIACARESLGLPPPLPPAGHILDLLHLNKPVPDLEHLRQKWKDKPDLLFAAMLDHYANLDKGLLGAESLAKALRFDLTQLAREAREKNLATGRVLVLLDDVHKYAEGIDALFDPRQKVLNFFGMGTREEPVPVIFTYSLGTPAEHKLKPITDRPTWGRVEDLQQFREENGEDLLACEQVLMHPCDSKGPAEVAGKPLAVNPAAAPNIARTWQGMFRRTLKGIPDNLSQELIYDVALGAWEQEYLLPADDNAVLKYLVSMRQRAP